MFETFVKSSAVETQKVIILMELEGIGKANVKGTPEYFEVSLLIRRTLSRPTECSDFSAWVDFRLRTSATAYSLKQKMSCFVKMHVEKRTVIEPSHILSHVWITCVWKNFRLFWRLRHLKCPLFIPMPIHFTPCFFLIPKSICPALIPHMYISPSFHAGISSNASELEVYSNFYKHFNTSRKLQYDTFFHD